MRKGKLHKFVGVVNILFAILLLFTYLLPYISPKTFPFGAILTLSVTFLITINLLFVIFWLFSLNYRIFISVIVLFIGFFVSSPFYNISNTKNFIEDDLSLMSYNVRMFNIGKHINQNGIGMKMLDYIHKAKPDVLALQEFHTKYSDKLNFKYKYFVPKSLKNRFGQAIYSNYEVLNKGSLDFKQSSNNAIYVDILKAGDTIRIYNIHLQSLQLKLNQKHFGAKTSRSLLGHLKNRFEKQVIQTEKVLEHQKSFKGKSIICGDFNNTAYSWAYRKLLKGKQDAFLVTGSGFGATFNYYFPLRIDFILVDNKLKVNYFKTTNLNFSDHEAVIARINID